MARRFGRHGTPVRERIREFVHLHRPQVAIAAAVLITVVVLCVLIPQVSARQDYAQSFLMTEDAIRIGIRTGTEGFGQMDDQGNITGFDRDVVDEVLRRLVTDPKIYEYVPLTSQNAGASLKYGRVQIAAGMLSKGTTQTNGFTLTAPYYTDRVVAVVSDTSKLERISDLEGGLGYLATALSGSDAEEQLKKQGVEISLTAYSDYESALTDLSHSRINAVLMPYSTARMLQQAGYRILAEPIYDISYSIMLPTNSEVVAARMNRILADMLDDGTIATLRAKWNT